MKTVISAALIALTATAAVAQAPLGQAPIAQPLTVPVAPSADKVQPLEVGARIPNVSVKMLDGKTVSLPQLVSAQPTVLVFYRGGWCPFCNAQMASLQKAQSDLKDLGYCIVAISPDRAEELQKSVGKRKLTYSLASDSSLSAAKAFGVAFKVDDATYDKYKGYGINLETASGEKHHLLPVPSVFLVGTDGMIRYRYFNPDYRVRLSSDELIAAAKQVPYGAPTPVRKPGVR